MRIEYRVLRGRTRGGLVLRNVKVGWRDKANGEQAEWVERVGKVESVRWVERVV